MAGLFKTHRNFIEKTVLITQPVKNEAQVDVLFDEDYQSCIERLYTMLERERTAVFDLREQVKRLQFQLDGVTADKNAIYSVAVKSLREDPVRKIRVGNRTFICGNPNFPTNV